MRADIQALETTDDVVYGENSPKIQTHRPMVSVEIIQ